MSIGICTLPWLPESPDRFGEQVRTLLRMASEGLAAAQRLAGYRLGFNQLHSLGKAIEKLAANGSNVTRLGVLSNGTTEFLRPALSVSALRHGVCLNILTTGFDQIATESLDPESVINRARCHFVLLAVDHRGLPLAATPGDEHQARTTLNRALQYIDSITQGLRNVSGCTVIVQTIPQITARLFGSLDRGLAGTLAWLIDHFNIELRARNAGSSNLLLDIAALAESVGLDQWHDTGQWMLGKFAFAHEIVPLYADWAARLIAAARGRSRKCPVLDLDNTIWGGVIGDDGLDGIVLGNGSPAGEAYLAVQRTALALRERGILLAVSSRNDESIARSAFRSHPEMLLKEEHIAVFQANWSDKASNLKVIAEKLNLGLDSLVLLDDNPAERVQVRDALPAVAVPELPPDPTLYPEILLAAGYFETTSFTEEDRNRAQLYQGDAVRAELLSNSTDLNTHLRSLNMRGVFKPFNRIARRRIAQLINKTNQFNLTTRRYTESEVEAFESSGSGLTLQIRLIDRFGDNGIIAIVICVEQTQDWRIDTWLMSCRVLNRKVEFASKR